MERVGPIYVVNSVRDATGVYLTPHIIAPTTASSIVLMDTDTRDISDKLDSLHRRMDKFYEWAAILQKEFRDMKQRQGFLESQCDVDFKPSANATQSLYERLERIKDKK